MPAGVFCCPRHRKGELAASFPAVLESDQDMTCSKTLCSPAHNRSGTGFLFPETVHFLCVADTTPPHVPLQEFELKRLVFFLRRHRTDVSRQGEEFGLEGSSVEVIMRRGLPLAS